MRTIFLTKTKKILAYLECCFAAVAFAEADCAEYCKRLLTDDRKPQKSLKMFLEDIGLYHVPIRYGVAVI